MPLNKKMEFPVEFWIAFWSEIIELIKLVISGHKWTFFSALTTNR